MACPNCGSREAPRIIRRMLGPRIDVPYFNCMQEDCGFSTWDRKDFEDKTLADIEEDEAWAEHTTERIQQMTEEAREGSAPQPFLEAPDVTWDISREAPIRRIYNPPIRLLSNPRPVNWERE